MKRNFISIGLLVLFSLTLAGCQSAGTKLTEEATTFTRGELYSYLSENTQVRGEGGIYYSEAGVLETIVDGERADGTWSTHDDGMLCRHIDGQEDSCESYYHNGDVVSTVSDGATALAPKLLSGNTVILKEMYSADQVTELVSGNTVIWDPNGGAFYDPSGKLYTTWDGVKENGSWEINADNALCWNVPSWGSTPCEAYYMGAEGLRVIYGGKDTDADEFQAGDALNLL